MPATAASVRFKRRKRDEDKHRNPGRLMLWGDLAGQPHPVLITMRVKPIASLRLGLSDTRFQPQAGSR